MSKHFDDSFSMTITDDEYLEYQELKRTHERNQMSLADKLRKNSKIKLTSVLEDSVLFNKKDCFSTKFPSINIALSGSLDGGMQPGFLQIAGPSKHFKSSIALEIASAYLQKYKDAIILFYDSEFGSTKAYFQKAGIDISRVVHTPITNIEELKFDIMAQLEQITRGEKVFILIDSIGNLASKKEVEDALKENSAADMSRAKQLKSLFRMITPHLVLKDIPMVGINHTYKEIGMFPKDVVGGGCVVPETLVKMADGEFKQISQISPGEEVATLLGSRAVEFSWNHETLFKGEPECYEITFDDGYTITCSDVHQFLNSKEMWIKAEDICIGDQFSTVSS